MNCRNKWNGVSFHVYLCGYVLKSIFNYFNVIWTIYLPMFVWNSLIVRTLASLIFKTNRNNFCGRVVKWTHEHKGYPQWITKRFHWNAPRIEIFFWKECFSFNAELNNWYWNNVPASWPYVSIHLIINFVCTEQ